MYNTMLGNKLNSYKNNNYYFTPDLKGFCEKDILQIKI